MAGQYGSEGESQGRHDLVQTAAWFIVFLFTLPLMSGPIIGLSPVPEVTAILLVLFVLAGIMWLLQVIRGGIHMLLTSLDLSLAVVWLAVLITTVFSLDPSRSWRVTAYWTAFVVAFYIIVLAVRSGWRAANLIRAYLIVLLIYIAVGYLELLSWLAMRLSSDGLLPIGGSVIRVAGLANNPNPFAALLAVGIVLALASYLDRPTGRRRWPFLIWLIAAAPMVVLHGSRNGWLATAAGLAGLLLFSQLRRFSPDLPPRRSWLKIAGFMIVALAITLGLALVLRPHTVNLFAGSGYANRSIFWRVAVETWLANPITGQGPGTYASAFLGSVNVPFEPLFVAAHSFWFDTLAEMGLVGTAAFVFLIWQTTRLANRSLRDGRWAPETRALLAALATIGAFSLLDTPWIHLKFLAAVILAAFVGQAEPAYSLSDGASVWRVRLPMLWIPAWAILVFVGVIGWMSASDYGKGINSAANGRWTVALAEFESAEDRLPYRDASFLLAEGYAAGVLASTDPSFLPAAIAAYESLVELEPGWSLNWANLAALHWQADRKDEAVATMKEAIERAPGVLIYQLNLAVWQEQTDEGGEAVATYQELLALDPYVADSSFWSATEARQDALSASGVVLDESSPRNQSLVAAATDADEGQTQEVEELLKSGMMDNSIYGFGRSKRSNYVREVFVRLDLPAELLPQLRCPSPRTQDRHGHELLRASAERNGLDEVLTTLDDAPPNGPDGLVSCTRPELLIPQTLD